MRELWRTIGGYEGLYEVSTFGRVRSLPRNYGYGTIAAPIILKPEVIKGGYLRVRLSKYGKRERFLINRLVATAFVPNPHNKPIVNHLDTVRTNNRADNLEWATYKENSNHADCPQKIGRKLSKAVTQCSLDGTPIRTFPSMTAAAKSVEQANLSDISICTRNPLRTSGGYKWRLAYVNSNQVGG